MRNRRFNSNVAVVELPRERGILRLTSVGNHGLINAALPIIAVLDKLLIAGESPFVPLFLSAFDYLGTIITIIREDN